MKQLQVGEMSTAYRFILKKSLKIPKGNQNRYPYIEEERVNLVTNPVISHELGKDREVFTTSRTYPWSFVTQIFHNGQPSHGWRPKNFRSDDFNLTERNPYFSSLFVSSNSLPRIS